MKKFAIVTFVLATAGLVSVTVYGWGGPIATQPRTLEDGRIAIDRPTTITEPGSYVLTRNIGHGQDAAITITANDVDLDLGGFAIMRGKIFASDVAGVVIHDGTVVGDGWTGLELINVQGFAIRRLTIRADDDRSIVLGGATRNGTVEDIVITPLSSSHQVELGPDTEYIEIARVRCTEECELWLDGERHRIVGNMFGGIGVSGSGHTVRENTVGVYLWVSGSGHTIRDNSGPLSVASAYSNITGNSALALDEFGIRFLESSHDNIYRANTARGNNGIGCTGTASGGDFCDEGTNNTSHGDNYMPGQM